MPSLTRISVSFVAAFLRASNAVLWLQRSSQWSVTKARLFFAKAPKSVALIILSRDSISFWWWMISTFGSGAFGEPSVFWGAS